MFRFSGTFYSLTKKIFELDTKVFFELENPKDFIYASLKQFLWIFVFTS